jgi:hypothetical protein
MAYHSRYKPLPETRQRLIDLRNADVPTWRIERILGVQETTLRKYFPDVFDEERGGQKPWEPSPKELQQIEVMAGLGLSHKQIGMVIGVTPYVLRTHCPDILDRAELLMNLQVGANLFKMATGDPTHKNTAMTAIWWSKARMGWKDTSRVESTGPNGGPVTSQVQITLPDNGREDQQPPLIEGDAEPDEEEA